MQPGARRAQLDVDARRFVDRALDLADVGDLAAQVEVQQLQAVVHARALQLLERSQHFGDGQAELGAVAAGRLPAARAAAGQLDAHADDGRTPTRSACLTIRSSSVNFSTTGMICLPIFWASITISMYSSSLKPLQMIGVSLSAIASTASSSGFEPASRPNLIRLAEVEDFFDDLPLLVHLDRDRRSSSRP